MVSRRLNDVLKLVSRSFYLSLRYLPRLVQQPLSLAYLLARLTDTIADRGIVPLAIRMDLIVRLQQLFRTPNDLEFCNKTTELLLEYAFYFKNSDVVLIENSCVLFALLNDQTFEHQRLIQNVLDCIIEGQLIDLRYFDAQPGIVHFTTAEALDNYVYYVAGSVGEFWTKLCCMSLPQYANRDMDELLPYAISFGKALQLTNILRDVSSDLALGRCYLPCQETIQGDTPELFMDKLVSISPSIMDQWREQAMHYLEDARCYIACITHRRVKFAALLPLLMAEKTLQLLHQQPGFLHQSTMSTIKISRKQVYWSIGYALCLSYVPFVSLR